MGAYGAFAEVYDLLMDEIEAAAPEATLTFECMDGAGCARRLAEYGWLER